MRDLKNQTLPVEGGRFPAIVGDRLPRVRKASFAGHKTGVIDEDYVRPGATVIDVGIHRTEDGLRGDVDFDSVSRIAELITPVPGGVGPMTIAMLMRNTLRAAELQGFDMGDGAQSVAA